MEERQSSTFSVQFHKHLKEEMFLICKCTVTIATTEESLFLVLNWVFMLRIVVSAIHENNKNIVRLGKERVGRPSTWFYLNTCFSLLFLTAYHLAEGWQ